MPQQNSNEKKLPKHHYIPVFYLKQWVGANGCLCEYSKPFNRVKPRRTSPDGTGYVRGLYRLPNVSDEKAEIIETIYMRDVDNGAAPALKVLLEDKGGPSSLTKSMKIYWARFVYCLMLRNPEYLAALSTALKNDVLGTIENHRADYERLRKELDPPTFDEFKMKFFANPLNTSAARILNKIVDSLNVVGHMCAMKWHVLRFDNSNHLLLTSDRPIIMTNGVGRPEGHIAMPISPHQMFIAFSDDAGYRKIRAMNAKDLIRASNSRVVEQAHKYAYGFSDGDLSFVSDSIGKTDTGYTTRNRCASAGGFLKMLTSERVARPVRLMLGFAEAI